MIDPQKFSERKLKRARAAGERWKTLTERRAETVRRLREGGPMNADSPERVERFRAREAAKRLAMLRAGVPAGFFMERRIGPTLDLDDDPPTDAARIAGEPVGRIVSLNRRGEVIDGFATGFLIGGQLLITNHHVFADPSDVPDCGIQFGYERINGQLARGALFRLAADIFFHADDTLDYAIVGIDPESGSKDLERYRALPLDPMIGKILVGQPISIIQHPDGGPKKYGVRDNELLIAPAPEDLFVQYTTDTLPGSSGSPAFNKDWEVVALHSSGVPEVKDGAIMTLRGEPWRRGVPDEQIHWIANEGARLSCIYQALQRFKPRVHEEALYRRLMNSFGQDFSTLPALQTAQESEVMDSMGTAGRVTINVAGPGNFYFAPAPALPVPAPQQPPGAPPRPSVTEKKIVFNPDYDARPGYDEDFLGIKVPHPHVSDGRAGEMLKEDGDIVLLKYHHYSLAMNRTWRTVMWAAANADYTKEYRRKSREEFGDDTWVPDPRILGKYQIMDQELYAPAALFDRGHVIRRDDVAWGHTAREEVFANSDSFHWTNCTPQHEAFNRDMFEYSGIGVWGMLENHIAKQARNVGNKMTLFAGPMLTDQVIKHDFGGGRVKIPLRFWKVLVVAEDSGSNNARLRAYGFILDQSYAIHDYGLELKERFDVGDFDTYQVTLEDITQESGVMFPNVVLDADAYVPGVEESRGRKLKSLEDVIIR